MNRVQLGFFALLIGLASVGRAQSPAPAAPAAPVAPANVREVFERLDQTALGLVAVAALIVALLVWRIVVMVRRERAAPLPAARTRTRRSTDDEPPLDQPTLTQATDWGFDQNKRGAVVRAPVAVEETSTALPSLEHAITQWSEADRLNATNIGVMPEDALGRSPVAPPPSPYRTGFNPYFRPERAPEARIEVEEVADTLMQAELLVQLGDPKQAMNLLSQHIRETEKPGPAVWLMLLDLYQSTGREAQYNALSNGFKTLFNAEVPPWATGVASNAREIEGYPAVLARIQSSWNGPQRRSILEGLLADTRGGSRQGFTLTAYRDILFLIEIVGVLDTMSVEDDERRDIRAKLGK